MKAPGIQNKLFFADLLKPKSGQEYIKGKQGALATIIKNNNDSNINWRKENKKRGGYLSQPPTRQDMTQGQWPEYWLIVGG